MNSSYDSNIEPTFSQNSANLLSKAQKSFQKSNVFIKSNPKLNLSVSFKISLSFKK